MLFYDGAVERCFMPISYISTRNNTIIKWHDTKVEISFQPGNYNTFCNVVYGIEAPWKRSVFGRVRVIQWMINVDLFFNFGKFFEVNRRLQKVYFKRKLWCWLFKSCVTTLKELCVPTSIVPWTVGTVGKFLQMQQARKSSWEGSTPPVPKLTSNETLKSYYSVVVCARMSPSLEISDLHE